MQFIEMLKRRRSFDEKGGFCKNDPFHRRRFWRECEGDWAVIDIRVLADQEEG